MSGRENEKLRAAEQGERAFEEGLAVLDCLREACDGRSALPLAAVATVLDVMRERITQAQDAFGRLS